LDDVLQGKSAPIATPLPPTMATVPAPQMPPVPDTALERFRADTIADRLLDPKAVWESRLKSATARIGGLTLSSDGQTLFAGALNWDSNLYALDSSTGLVRWTRHAGQNYVPHVWAGANGAVFAHIQSTSDLLHVCRTLFLTFPRAKLADSLAYFAGVVLEIVSC
jgi:outer membrane protein assembly factor BamB